MLSKVVAALYGGTEIRPLTRIARPQTILSCLQKQLSGDREPTISEIIDVLQRENFVHEALLLSTDGALETAQWQLDEGLILTVACDAYPQRLRESLGATAPPVIWISEPSLRSNPAWQAPDGLPLTCISAVGCRVPLPIGLYLAQQVGSWTAKNQYLAVSGGAIGCDSAFGNAAHESGTQVVHILPFGMNRLNRDLQGYAISVCPPTEPFSAARAMERNKLIYAFGHMTVVCSARYRQGGSWIGASNALKAHRPVVVADWASSEEDDSSGLNYAKAQRTLINLGARSLNLGGQLSIDDLSPNLDEALSWSLDKLAGAITTGLFDTR